MSRARLTAAGVLTAAALLVAAPIAEAGSVKRVNYRAADTESIRTFFDHGGLKLRGDCDDDPPNDDQLEIRAKTRYDDAMIHWNGQGFFDAYAEDDDFDTGEEHDFLDGGLGSSADDNSTGQLIYARPGGKVVTIKWLAEENGAYGGERDCVFVGAARVLDSSSTDRVSFKVDDGVTSPVTFLDKGGLELNGECDGGGDLTVSAVSGAENSTIHYNAQSVSGDDYDEEDDFDAAESEGILQELADDSSTSGELTYVQTDGTVVTVDFAAEDGGAALGKDCVFVGTARVRSTADPKRAFFSAGTSTPVTTFFEQAGLRLRGECSGGGLVEMRSRSTIDHSMLHLGAQNAVDGAGYFEDDSLNNDSDEETKIWTLSSTSGTSGSGQIVFSTRAGTHVTIDYLSEDGSVPLGGTTGCLIAGTAEVAAP